MNDRVRLLQEDYKGSEWFPWKVLVICQCLNKVSWMTAEKVVVKLFTQYPSPANFDLLFLTYLEGSELEIDLYAILRPLGFGMKRVYHLIDMSQAYVDAMSDFGSNYEEYPVTSFSGCGQYALDAWRLFVLKKACRPDDRLLRKYAEREGLWRDDFKEHL